MSRCDISNAVVLIKHNFVHTVVGANLRQYPDLCNFIEVYCSVTFIKRYRVFTQIYWSQYLTDLPAISHKFEREGADLALDYLTTGPELEIPDSEVSYLQYCHRFELGSE
jgi:hypothetical protein